MKKLYSLIALLALAAGFVGCSSDEVAESLVVANSGKVEVLAYTGGTQTRTTLADDFNVLWSENDQIIIGRQLFTLSDGYGTTKGTFTGTVQAIDGSYDVYYPSTYNGSNWPTKQVYVSANDISCAPMKATATVSGGAFTSALTFTNEGGILRLVITGNEDTRIKKITFTADAGSPLTEVTLFCGEGVALSSIGEAFNLCLPKGTYTNPRLTFNDNKDLLLPVKKSASLTIKQNVVTKLPLSSLLSPEGLIITVHGRKGIVVNVGTTTIPVWKIASLYALGASEDDPFNPNYYKFDDVTSALTAYSGWYLPSKDELQNFITIYKDQYAWNNGDVNVTIGSNTLTLPGGYIPAGREPDMAHQLFWSQTQASQGNAYAHHFDANTSSTDKLSVAPWDKNDKLTVLPFHDLPSQSSTGPDVLYIVTFKANGHGTAPADQLFDETGMRVAKPADPTESGYVFGGWYKEASCINVWNFDDNVTQSMTLYAKWIQKYTVSFDLQGHGATIGNQTIAGGQSVTKPEDPIATDYVFGGWYKDNGCNSSWDFARGVVNSDMILYAKWTPNFIVRFDMKGHGGIVPISQTFSAEGQKAVSPEPPTETGYEFGGWYKETECVNAWAFDREVVSGSMTLYAKWNPIYTVRFDLNGHGGTTSPVAQSIVQGNKVTKPTTDPSAQFLEFAGWCKDKECNMPWNFDSDVVNDNMILYAKWNPKSIIIHGQFSVSTEKKVYFSSGSLTYNVNDNKWGFYPVQNDYAKSYSSSLISLFTWGYDSSYSIIPSTTSFTNRVANFQDWGKAIDDNVTWETLSLYEWDYLLNVRTVKGGQGENHSYKFFSNLNGVAIYPDDYVGNYSESTVAAMTTAGIVFLPAAGNRSGSTLSVSGTGYYWSCSANDSTQTAFVLEFGASTLDTNAKIDKSTGCSVRLVTEVKNE